MMRTSYGKTLVIAGMLLTLAFSLGAFAADEPAKKEEGAKLVPIDIELPKPLFVGTPKPIAPSPYLEPLSNEPRPPFLAPEGVKNVAAKKRVTSSDKEPIIGDMEQVTDGDKEAADGSFVELGPGKQWVQIDLAGLHDIYAIVIWHYHAEQRVYRDVVVQVSNDADFVTEVKTVFNNDYDNSAGLGVGKDKEYIETYQGKLINTKGVQGRYVRLYSNGSTSGDLNHYTEVEVYGKPASE